MKDSDLAMGSHRGGHSWACRHEGSRFAGYRVWAVVGVDVASPCPTCGQLLQRRTTEVEIEEDVRISAVALGWTPRA